MKNCKLGLISKLVRHVLELNNIYYIRQPTAMVSANVER